MSSNRKDEHLLLAKAQKEKKNAFDKIVLNSTDLPNLSMDDIDLSTTFLGYKIKYPFYINAMTGGSLKGYEVNNFLSQLASHFDIPFVTGSQSIALKDQNQIESFAVVRKNHSGLVIGNLNANATSNDAKKALSMINGDGLSIHLNVIQELVMHEGDRDFTLWSKNIKDIVATLDKPVLVKQVGMGLSEDTIKSLLAIGVKHMDVAGSGGTSFLDIESKRSGKDYSYLNEFGLETADILLNLNKIKDIIYYASGGIRNPLDVIKSLVLGANAVGLSRWFLNLTDLSIDEAIIYVNDFILDLKKIMIIIGAKDIYALKDIKYQIEKHT